MSPPGMLPKEHISTHNIEPVRVRVCVCVNVHMYVSMCVKQMGGKREIREG